MSTFFKEKSTVITQPEQTDKTVPIRNVVVV